MLIFNNTLLLLTRATTSGDGSTGHFSQLQACALGRRLQIPDTAATRRALVNGGGAETRAILSNGAPMS
jgi:hypothetical protein